MVLSRHARLLVLMMGFLAWMFGGLQIATFTLIARPAVIDIVGRQQTSDSTAAAPNPQNIETQAAVWFSRYQAALMFGMAAGGWLFGALGDRLGRSRAMGLSVLCYSLLSGASYFATSLEQLFVLRFLSSLGVGGVWPNAVSLVAEAWPDVSRPMLAGLLGTAANFGFVLLGFVAYQYPVTNDAWRWVLVFGAAPAVIGVFTLAAVPESPKWLARRPTVPPTGRDRPIAEIFRRPILERTLIGICLGAVPVIGTSANANWIVPWTDQATDATTKVTGPQVAAAGAAGVAPKPAKSAKGDPRRKAWTLMARSSGAMLGSLVGGWLASLLGRRVTYFLISLSAFVVSMCLYQYLHPLHPWFDEFAFLLGFTGVTYFGWLPLYLPELFPTRVRSTGTGVTFNSGRIFAGLAALGAGYLSGLFDGDYARVGTWTSLIYAAGMVIIFFAPDTSNKKLED